jgi:Fe-S cluster biogenesis protein NfuA
MMLRAGMLGMVRPHAAGNPSRKQVFDTLRRFLLITTESTPNPNTMKFKPMGKTLVDTEEGYDFRSAASAKKSPLAKQLLMIEGVSGVFIGKDFIAVTKKGDGDDSDVRWQQLKVFVFSTIMEFFDNPKAMAVLPDEKLAETANLVEPDDSEIVQMIKELLEEKVRPMARDDGGDVLFKGFDEKEGVVSVQLVGSCVGCPSSTITLKNGVENMLRHYIPEVKRVDAVVGEVDADDQTHHLSFKPEDQPASSS